MLAYIIRRIAYAVPILLGVNIILFMLYFVVNTPDDMAAVILGEKRVTQEQIDNWKREHNYHLPLYINTSQRGTDILTQTIFWQKSMCLFWFNFGKSDTEETLISSELKNRIPYSLALTIPMFFASLLINLFFAMMTAFHRGTYIDTWALVICVVMMSISGMFYIIGGQALIAIKLKLAPVSGFDTQFPYTIKFLVLPVAIGIASRIGGGIRYYRTIFLEEISKDYVRTSRAKGLSETNVLFKHVLKNAMIPILTDVVVSIPFLIMGSMLLENFFGIPGLGGYLIEAIARQDFAVVRAMAFLGSALFILGLIAVDISYTFVDPRIRLK